MLPQRFPRPARQNDGYGTHWHAGAGAGAGAGVDEGDAKHHDSDSDLDDEASQPQRYFSTYWRDDGRVTDTDAFQRTASDALFAMCADTEAEGDKCRLVLGRRRRSPLRTQLAKVEAGARRHGLELDAVLNRRNAAGLHILHVACRSGRFDIVEELLAYAPLHRTVTRRGFADCMIAAAAAGNHPDVILRLHSHPLLRTIKEVPGDGRTTALMEAAKSGAKEAVDLLLSGKGPSAVLSARNADGDTAFMLACRSGHKEVALALADDPRSKIGLTNKNGETCFHAMAALRPKDAFEPLPTWRVPEEHEVAEREELQRVMARRFACWEAVLGHPRVKRRISLGAPAAVAHGCTALHFAAASGSSDLVRSLLQLPADRGVDPNARGVAVEAKPFVTTAFFVDHDSQIERPRSLTAGITPLMAAVGTLNVSCVMELVRDPRVDLDARNDNGTTALDMLVDREPRADDEPWAVHWHPSWAPEHDETRAVIASLITEAKRMPRARMLALLVARCAAADADGWSRRKHRPAPEASREAAATSSTAVAAVRSDGGGEGDVGKHDDGDCKGDDGDSKGCDTSGAAACAVPPAATGAGSGSAGSEAEVARLSHKLRVLRGAVCPPATHSRDAADRLRCVRALPMFALPDLLTMVA